MSGDLVKWAVESYVLPTLNLAAVAQGGLNLPQTVEPGGLYLELLHPGHLFDPR